ncbi:MAG: 50S ribosomal protein L15 [Candidatus Nealsonbacteria bacterium CG23_combo_of_CG06-09_8_20_14_all_38_19]|uniref:Large ribosomal subunit protein uL15 n=1 Tax=Candidatus Nealsonbacteria bacterium CG23_combo_of_CG06-09_8_20_14_all_38_19 TaxID=1974721 RepID=A0A2G9YWA0_9BACT|nr:MAG: 50S ribosomal protein L15 [Candidatus Nealsonbacteria bacterium CG23_combo_of_CG06-09_8_20_14_all_38_19]
MQLHELKPTHKNKKPKRVGRGGKRGTYSGKGIKGQKARAGRRFKPMIRELIKRYPKLKGYKFKKLMLKPSIVNLEVLEKNFEDSDTITPEALLQKNLVRRIKGRAPQVKILGNKDIKKLLIVEGCLVSKSAKEKIEKAGGKII